MKLFEPSPMLSENPNNDVFMRVNIIFGHLNYIIIKYGKHQSEGNLGIVS